MERITFKFVKWSEFQGDAKRYESTSWFRMQNTAWMSPVWDSLDDKEWRAFNFLLMYVSQKAHREGFIELPLATIHRMSGITAAVIKSTVRKLCELGIAEIENGTDLSLHSAETVHAQCAHGATKITNEDNEDNETKILKGVACAPPNAVEPVVSLKQVGRYRGKPDEEREFVATYVRAYQIRYGLKARPECLNDGSTIGLVREFLRNRPLDRACDLIQVYLQMDDAWFLKNHHDLQTFKAKINQIGLALISGRDPSKPMTFLEYMREREKGGGSEDRRIQRADTAVERGVRRPALPEPPS